MAQISSLTAYGGWLQNNRRLGSRFRRTQAAVQINASQLGIFPCIGQHRRPSKDSESPHLPAPYAPAAFQLPSSLLSSGAPASNRRNVDIKLELRHSTQYLHQRLRRPATDFQNPPPPNYALRFRFFKAERLGQRDKFDVECWTSCLSGKVRSRMGLSQNRLRFGGYRER